MVDGLSGGCCKPINAQDVWFSAESEVLLEDVACFAERSCADSADLAVSSLFHLPWATKYNPGQTTSADEPFGVGFDSTLAVGQNSQNTLVDHRK